MRLWPAVLLSLPLSVMLSGLLAAALPVPWASWLVLMLLLVVTLWMLLVALAALSQRGWPALAGLLAANGVALLLLQATTLYGGGP